MLIDNISLFGTQTIDLCLIYKQVLEKLSLNDGRNTFQKNQ